MTTPRGSRAWRIDAAICVLVAIATATYVGLRRWTLGASDEGYYFYHAVRIVRGEVLYRDVFELTTPLLIDLLALTFRLFGATFAVGRAVGTAVQTLIAVAIYSGARTVGVGRVLAVAAVLVHLAIAQSAWPYTTPHWLAIFFVCVLLIVASDRERARRRGWTVFQGVLLGLLFATRQHAGVALILGVGLLTIADAFADWRWGTAGPSFASRAALLAVATLAGAAVVMVPHIARAGIGPMIAELVVHPLTGYHTVNRVSWGWNSLLEIQPYTFRPLLVYLPAVVGVTAVRAGVAWVRGGDRRPAERLLVLTVFGASAMAYTMSFPDVIHIAMITPVILIVAAELVAAVLSGAGPAGPIVGVAVIVACAVHLERNFVGSRAQFPIAYDTAFGRIFFASQSQVDDIARMWHVVDAIPGRELYCYPGCPAGYLMIGARNPTRHELAFPVYQSDEEIAGIIATLDRRQVGHVALVQPFIGKGDPVAAYVREHYRCSTEPVALCVRDGTS